MESTSHTPAERLSAAAEQWVCAVREFHGSCPLSSISDATLVGLLARAGEVLRAAESVAVVTTGEAAERSRSFIVEDRLTTRLGFTSVRDLVQRSTRVSGEMASRWERLAGAIMQRQAVSSSEPLPPALPALRHAVLDCEISIDAAFMVARVLLPKNRTFDASLLEIADEAIAESARGPEHPAAADELGDIARAWVAAIDQDGTEPTENAALKARYITLGRVRDGLVPIKGLLLPEVGEQIAKIMDAVTTPRKTGVTFRPSHEKPACEVCASDPQTSEVECRCDLDHLDQRTPAQKRHDALATAVFVAAASRELPTIGGAAPTLLVTMSADDPRTAYLPRISATVSVDAAEHAGCSGAVQRAIMIDGRINHISSVERTFTQHQRRAIAMRDGGCVIPGCRVPANWAEIHHVREWSAGGETHTDNGVMLCWHHHRYLATSGWHVRIIEGVAEVQAPPWLDPTGRWRKHARATRAISDRLHKHRGLPEEPETVKRT